jgi:hypothetical protein
LLTNIRLGWSDKRASLQYNSDDCRRKKFYSTGPLKSKDLLCAQIKQLLSGKDLRFSGAVKMQNDAVILFSDLPIKRGLSGSTSWDESID